MHLAVVPLSCPYLLFSLYQTVKSTILRRYARLLRMLTLRACFSSEFGIAVG